MKPRIIAWGKKVERTFVNKILDICKDFEWDDDHASYLMSCIAFESAETFSPTIRNAAGSGAIGLIQFMPATALILGTTTTDLAKMTAVEQLDFVKAYFRPYYRRIDTLSDMYMAILLPKYIGKPEDSALFLDGTVAYRQNSGLDANKDGRITKKEAASKVQKKLERGLELSRALYL